MKNVKNALIFALNNYLRENQVLQKKHFLDFFKPYVRVRFTVNRSPMLYGQK